MCDCTRYVFAYTLTDKKQVHVALRSCLDEISHIQKERYSVFTIKTESGSEYKTSQMKELLLKEEIKIVTSEP